jgi:hypothetical protein
LNAACAASRDTANGSARSVRCEGPELGRLPLRFLGGRPLLLLLLLVVVSAALLLLLLLLKGRLLLSC